MLIYILCATVIEKHLLNKYCYKCVFICNQIYIPIYVFKSYIYYYLPSTYVFLYIPITKFFET